MHAIRKLINSSISGDSQVATVEVNPSIPIDKAEDRAIVPQLLSTTDSSHTLQLIYMVLGDKCMQPSLD